MTLQLAPDLALGDDFAGEASAILARRGRGKTYTASVLAEELHAAGQPFAVLDPVGVWYGLRSSPDGTKPGLPVTILGGEHGDVPLEATAGALIATFVVDNPGAYVIDLSSFESKGGQDRFVTEFAERIYRYKSAQARRRPLTLIVDEADQFAPQNPRERGGYVQRMIGAFESIVRQGRARGLGCVLITQRPAVLNKNALTQAGALILLGVTGPQDRKAIDDWVRGHADEDQRRQVVDSLAGLGVGEAWVWWPTEDLLQRVTIRRRRTFDSSSTPKAGEHPETVRFADVDLDALKDAISDTVERAKADDPKLLHARIRDLERDLRETRAVTSEPIVERIEVEVPFVSDELVARLEAISEPVFALSAAVRDLLAAAGDLRGGTSKGTVARTIERTKPPKPQVTRSTSGDTSADTGPLPEGERKVLTAVAQQGTDGAARDQISILTGYKRSTRDTYIQRLAARGHVEIAGGLVYATDAGVEALGDGYEPLPTGADLQAYWLDRLPEGEAAVLRILVDAWPAGVARETISDGTGYKRSTRDTYLQRLRARKLVTGDREPCAADTLFDEGI